MQSVGTWPSSSASVSSAEALIPLTIVVWAALGLGVGHPLTRLPPAVEFGVGLWRRIVTRVAQLGYWLAIAVMLVLGGLALFLTYRAIGLTML